MEGCPLLTHHALRAVAETSVDAGRPLLAALRVLNLSQSAGGCCVLDCGAGGAGRDWLPWQRFSRMGAAANMNAGACGAAAAQRTSACRIPLATSSRLAGARSDFVLFIERLQYRCGPSAWLLLMLLIPAGGRRPWALPRPAATRSLCLPGACCSPPSPPTVRPPSLPARAAAPLL